MDHLIYYIDYRDRWTWTLVSADMLVQLLCPPIPDRGHGRGHRHDVFKKKIADTDMTRTNRGRARPPISDRLYNIAPGPGISNKGFLI